MHILKMTASALKAEITSQRGYILQGQNTFDLTKLANEFPSPSVIMDAYRAYAMAICKKTEATIIAVHEIHRSGGAVSDAIATAETIDSISGSEVSKDYLRSMRHAHSAMLTLSAAKAEGKTYYFRDAALECIMVYTSLINIKLNKPAPFSPAVAFMSPDLIKKIFKGDKEAYGRARVQINRIRKVLNVPEIP